MFLKLRFKRKSMRGGLLVLLFLACFVSACSTATTSNISPTATTTQGIRGSFHESTLSSSQFVPTSITTGPDGNLWFSAIMMNQSGFVQTSKIERITPTGTLSGFSLPSANAAINDIVAGPDGNLWFTETILNGSGIVQGSKIGSITPAGKITEFPVPSSPSSITIGPDGNLWFTEQLVTVDQVRLA